MTASEERDGDLPSPSSSTPAGPAVVFPTSSPVTECSGGGTKASPAPREEAGGNVVIDVGEKVCRICLLSPDRGEGKNEEDGTELIQLGCGCKDGLGVAHRHCAEAWFKLRGSRCCEICGSTAKNVSCEDSSSRFMEEWHERRVLSRRNSSERGGCWRRQPFCNFLMACLVIAFILPWFFRANML